MTSPMIDNLDKEKSDLHAYIDNSIDAIVSEKFEGIQSQMEQMIQEVRDCRQQVGNRATLVVFSGDMDKLISAFMISTGAAAMGMDVSMYFAFWGLTALKKKTVFKGKPITEKMMALMLPSGPDHLTSSKMNILGVGPAFFKHVMKKKNVQSLPDLIQLALEMDVQMTACRMSMEVMGLTNDELLDGIGYGGVATYLADASDSKITLFI